MTPTRMKLALLAMLAGALALAPPRPAAAPASAALQACLEAHALPQRAGAFLRQRSGSTEVMGGQDLWAEYAVMPPGPSGGQARLRLTLGLGPRAWHPWTQSYRLAGDAARGRELAGYRPAGGTRLATTVWSDTAGQRWAVASMRCQSGGCFTGPFRLWLNSWWSYDQPAVAVHLELLSRRAHRRAWYRPEMDHFLRAWNPAPITACLATARGAS